VHSLAILDPARAGALTTVAAITQIEAEAVLEFAETPRPQPLAAPTTSPPGAPPAAPRLASHPIGTARDKKTPATHDIIGEMLDAFPDTPIGKCERALLAFGFAGEFRRAELVALEVADLVEVADGLRVVIRHGKTDQEGQGAEIAIPRGYRLRPVEAIQTWLAAAEISRGSVFRSVARGGRVGTEALSPYAASLVIKQRIAAIGLDSATYSGHSLRSGFLTSAAEAGASLFKLTEVSRHKSLDTLRGYVRRVDLFKEYAGAAFL
jgi:integrase